MLFKNLVILMVFVVASYAKANDQITLLTGIITSSEYHLVTAPKTNRWQVQIQWMADEGSIVNEGDLVVVFDSGGIESQLEVNEEKLETDALELLKLERASRTRGRWRLKISQHYARKNTYRSFSARR